MLRSIGLISLLLAPLAAESATVRLAPGVPIVLAADAPESIRRAVADLQRDLAAVLGAPSPLDAHAPANGACIQILAPDSTLGGPEAHAVRVVSSDGNNAPRVTLAGSDPRGVIYAIYTFSEKALGIPPLWYFAQWKPARLDALELPADFAFTAPPPYVRWRAWFPNDEDMYLAWERAAPDERYDRVLETMLRLKLNVIDLGDIIDYPSENRLSRARHAHARGFTLTTTHTNPLGTQWSNWEPFWRGVKHQEPPPVRLDQVKAMEEFWAYHIDLCRREGFDMIYEVGFRGKGDNSFANAFPDAPPDAAGQARIIGDMIKRQVALVHAHHGDGPLHMRTVLYNENSDYLAAGLLELPKDPDLIWNYVAARRDHFPAADIRSGKLPPTQPYGYYLNLQFTSTGAHLAPAEGPWKIQRNYEIIAKASPRPLEFWVVNAGNFREFLQELSAHASIAWTPAGWDADTFLHSWCAQYFGTAHADAAVAVLRDFYNSYWTQRAPDLPDFPRQYLFQDMRVARACDELLSRWDKPIAPMSDRNMGFYRIDPSLEETDDQFIAIQRGLGRSVEKLTAVAFAAEKLEPQLDARGRRLWHDHVREPAQVVLAADRALLAIVRGYRERTDASARLAALREADAFFVEMRTWLNSADVAPFEKWSELERLWGITAKRQRIAELTAAK